MASQRSRCAALDPRGMGRDFSLVPATFSSSFRRSLAKSSSYSCLNVNYLSKECNSEVFAEQSSSRAHHFNHLFVRLCQTLVCIGKALWIKQYNGHASKFVTQSYTLGDVLKTINAFKALTAITTALVTPMNVKTCLPTLKEKTSIIFYNSLL